jgi:ornithine carbamoyltransferase
MTKDFKKPKKKDLISITDLSPKEILEIINVSLKLKLQTKLGEDADYLKNKNLVMFFEKPSLRTKLSFDIGIKQLGGNAIYFGANEVGFGVRESIEDIAKTTSSMANMIMARTYSHETVEKLAKNSDVAVINGLSDLEHPCQALADLLTIYETKGTLSGLKVAFIGDGNNNVTHSLALACASLGMNFSTACPQGYFMDEKISNKVNNLAKKSGSKVLETTKIGEAVKNADIVYTDTWVSMGDEAEKEQRIKDFKGYTVNEEVMSLAKKDAHFMHDMPAYRGFEVSSDVMDGDQSLAFKQAENRLHAQKGLMLYLSSFNQKPKFQIKLNQEFLNSLHPEATLI